MGHAHESNTKRIWMVFSILSAITIVEVIFGIIKPASLYHNSVLGLNLLNWIFILLTLWKAYYIAWSFMHLEGEKANFRWSIVAPVVFLIAYLSFIVLVEAIYVFDVFQNSHYQWIF